MQTYVIVRRSGWRTAEEFNEADRRADLELQRVDAVRRLRSYVLDERDGSVGTVCVYAAESPEALRRHAAAAGLPVDEIVKVAETVTARSGADEATADCATVRECRLEPRRLEAVPSESSARANV